MRNLHKSSHKQAAHHRDANSVKRTAEWKAFAVVLLLLVVGALFGAFVVAPLRWTNDPDFFGRQCLAAFLCGAIALFPGMLVFVGLRSLIGRFHKGFRMMSDRKKGGRENGEGKSN